MPLTKSDFLLYRESPLHLWCKAHGVERKEASLHDLHVAEKGAQVEQLAQQFLSSKIEREYPEGSTIEFEKTLQDGNYEARLDALVYDPVNETYDMYEIKSSTEVKSKHVYDVTFQYLVAQAHLPINAVYIVHVNKEYRLSGNLNLEQFFVIEDMQEEIDQKQDEVFEKRLVAWDTMRLPVAPKEEQCFNRKKCLYPSLCFADISEYPIFDLSKGNKTLYRQLLDQGIRDLIDVPHNFCTKEKQKLQLDSIKTGRPIIDHGAIAKQLNELQYPLYFLDYETYSPAVPLYDGYTPYQNITNQFSLHVVRSPDSNEVEHYEFLATEPGDPAPLLAAELCRVIGDTGSVIVWYKAFECSRNKELGKLCDEWSEQLESINARVYDLMDIFEQGHYVDYRFHGSASIKHVLPVLCPELSYKELEIGNGTVAMTKWYEMVHGELAETEREKIRADLLAYCKLDTWAMVEIWRRMRGVACSIGE
jgi:hypothetical protein